MCVCVCESREREYGEEFAEHTADAVGVDGFGVETGPAVRSQQLGAVYPFCDAKVADLRHQGKGGRRRASQQMISSVHDG